MSAFSHVVAQHAAQRRQQRGESPEVDLAVAVPGNDRFPREEIAQETLDGVSVLDRRGLPAVGGDIACQTNDLVDQSAVAVERPLVAVGVEDVGRSREALELIAVAASETGGGRAGAKGLELDISGEQLVAMNGVIRAAETVGKGSFAGADHVLAESAGGSGHEDFERTAHLVLGLARSDLRHFGCHCCREVLQGRVDWGYLIHFICPWTGPSLVLRTWYWAASNSSGARY